MLMLMCLQPCREICKKVFSEFLTKGYFEVNIAPKDWNFEFLPWPGRISLTNSFLFTPVWTTSPSSPSQLPAHIWRKKFTPLPPSGAAWTCILILTGVSGLMLLSASCWSRKECTPGWSASVAQDFSLRAWMKCWIWSNSTVAQATSPASPSRTWTSTSSNVWFNCSLPLSPSRLVN